MRDKPEIGETVKRILWWYKRYRRPLPWRKTRDPYHILVSEVMLQQTQVEKVVPKYHQFLQHFSTIKSLALASAGDVIRVWSGLGYNRRALFLARSAQMIENQYGGAFPRTLDELKKLPGIGEYTARAILSFAFEMPVIVLDTNHRQFYQRILCQGKDVDDTRLMKKVERIVLPLFSSGSRLYDWNQAIMDFVSALSKGIDDPILNEFRKMYPLKVQGKKKNSVMPFRQSDRYYRGRIVDVARNKKRVFFDTVHRRFSDIDASRLERILENLEKDGLIKRNGQSIMLPQIP